MAEKIEEYMRTRKIKEFKELEEKTAIRDVVTHFFLTKGVPLAQLKKDARKMKVVYARFTAPAKELIKLADSVSKAKEAITKVADWARSRDLDYAIETVFKKWLEIDKLKPKAIVKKAFYRGDPMVWSETKKKWFVVTPENEWLEFAGKESEMEWKIVK